MPHFSITDVIAGSEHSVAFMEHMGCDTGGCLRECLPNYMKHAVSLHVHRRRATRQREEGRKATQGQVRLQSARKTPDSEMAEWLKKLTDETLGVSVAKRLRKDPLCHSQNCFLLGALRMRPWWIRLGSCF